MRLLISHANLYFQTRTQVQYASTRFACRPPGGSHHRPFPSLPLSPSQPCVPGSRLSGPSMTAAVTAIARLTGILDRSVSAHHQGSVEYVCLILVRQALIWQGTREQPMDVAMSEIWIWEALAGEGCILALPLSATPPSCLLFFFPRLQPFY